VSDPLPVVAGDPAQFVHLLSDLVENGLRFVAEGVAPHIRISASRMVNAWCIDVTDNGIGVDPEHRAYVFGMFQRLRRNDSDGTGIGLAICKRIVEQRGGSIWVEANSQGGSRFRFTIPDELGVLGHDRGPDHTGAGGPELRSPAMGTAAPPAPSSSGIHGPSSAGPPTVSAMPVAALAVLLVEDDDDHARLVEETLASSPDGVHHLRRVRDLAGAQAELARRPADCILLDLFLPDGQGLESLTQLTTLDPLAPIVILTSLVDEELGLQAVHEGAQDYLVKGTVDGPRLARALRHAVERKALEARFAEQALHDPLTGLANRTLLLDRVRLELARSGRTGTGVAVFYLDIDRFKSINDRWGHAGGDEVLVRVARRLSRSVRPGDTVGRMGGDEFIVVCGGLDTDGDREQMRARIVEALERPLLLGVATELVTASIGIAVARAGEEPEAVIRRADEAMYQAKRS
jgi:diguanylate cyclase (GGDEF)-like protein